MKIYGFLEGDIEVVAKRIEEEIGVMLVPREGMHIGNYYSYSDGNNELILRKNYDPVFEEAELEDFTEYKILLYVDGNQQDGLGERVKGHLLLK